MMTLFAVPFFTFGGLGLAVQLFGSVPFSLMVGLALGLRGARSGVLFGATGIALISAAIVLVPSLLTHGSWFPMEREAPVPSRHGTPFQLFIWPPEIALAAAFALHGARANDSADASCTWIAGVAIGLNAEAFFWRGILRSFALEIARSPQAPAFGESIQMLIAAAIGSCLAALLLALPGWALGRLVYRCAGWRADDSAAPLPLAWLIWPLWILVVLIVRAPISG